MPEIRMLPSARVPPRRRRSIGLLVLVTMSTLSATGCTAEKPVSREAGAQSVASVPRAAATSAVATVTAVDDQRPLVRIDATEEEVTRLYKLWEKCLVREGGDRYKGAGEVVAGKGESALAEKQDAAQDACAAQQPERYEDRDKRTDPSGFKEHNLKMYRCAKAKGYHLTAPEADTGQFGLAEIGPQGDWGSAGITACRLEAFGAK